MRRERVIAFCDGLIEAVVIIATIVVFLLYGTMQDYLGGFLGASALVLMCGWYARFALTGTVYWVRNGLFLPAVVLLAVSAAHIVSVPPGALSFLSPRLLSLYRDVLGGTLPSVLPFALSAHASLFQLAYAVHLFVFLFVIVNVVYEKEFINRCIAVMVGIIAALSGLWIFQTVAPDLKEVIGNILNCREDSTSLLFSSEHFLWALVVPYFFCAGLVVSHLGRRQNSLYGAGFVLLTCAVLLCRDASVSTSIVFGALCFAILVISVSGMRWSLRIVSICAALGAGIVALSVIDPASGTPGAGAFLRNAGGVLRGAGLFGLGAGNLPVADAQAIGQSGFFSFCCRYGVIGVAGLLALAGVYVTGTVRMIRKRNDRYVRMVSIGGLSGIAALGAGAFLGAPFASPAVDFGCVVSAALVFVLLRTRPVDNADDGDAGATLFDVKVMKIRSTKTSLCVWLAFAAVVAVTVPVLRGSLAAYHYWKGMLRSPVETYEKIDMPYDTILSYAGNQAYLRRNESALRKAVELDPGNALYHEMLGKLYAGDGSILHDDAGERSRKAFSLACRLEPLSFAGKKSQPAAEAKVESARPSETVRQVDAGQYTRDASRIIGAAGGDRVRLVQEMERCRRIVAADPAAVDAILETCVQATDDYDLLKAVVKDLPGGPETLALFLFSRDLWEKNQDKFNADMRRTPKEGKYPYFKALAEISMQAGNYKGAILLMQDCVKVCPESAPAYFWVAEKASYYPKQYSPTFVEEMYRKAASADPRNFEYRLALCRHLFKSRKYQLAADELYRLSDEDPANPEAFYLMGRCYEELSLFARAIDAYRKVCTIDPAYKDARMRSERLKKK